MVKDIPTIEELHDQAVDGELKAFQWHAVALQEDWHQMEALDAYMGTYGVSTPAIKSIEEAKYGSQHYTGSNSNWVEKMEEYDAVKEDYYKHEKAIYETAKKLAKLSENELEILHEKYELRKTAQEMGDERFISRDTMLRRLALIRAKL